MCVRVRVCVSTCVPTLVVSQAQVQMLPLIFGFSHLSPLTSTSLSSDFIFPKHNWNTLLSYEECLMPPIAGGVEPRFLSMADLFRYPFTSVTESTGGTCQLMGPKSRWPS